jgi:hypothetical protein
MLHGGGSPAEISVPANTKAASLFRRLKNGVNGHFHHNALDSIEWEVKGMVESKNFQVS